MTYILIFAGLFLIFILGVYFQGSNKSHKVRQADLKDIGIISHYKGKPFTGTTEEKNGDTLDASFQADGPPTTERSRLRFFKA